MDRALALMGLLLSLGGCVVTPAEPGYGYGQPAYPGGEAYYDNSNVYPGYSYNSGSPSLFVEGSAMPLTYYQGGWGYWDRERHWHHAPDQVERSLQRHHAVPPPYAGGPRYEAPPPQRQDWHRSGGGRYGAPPPQPAAPMAMPGPGNGRHEGHRDDHPRDHSGDRQGHDRHCPGDRNC
jgi:hypothetical protein